MQRFAAPAVPGIVPHHAMYRAVHAAAAAAPPPPAPINNHSSSQLQLDAHPVSLASSSRLINEFSHLNDHATKTGI